MQNKRILIVGNYGAKNVGDDAILYALLSNLSGNKITVMCHRKKFIPNYILHKFGSVKYIERIPFGKLSFIRSLLTGNLFLTLITIFFKTDFAIVGGGGLFQGYKGKAIPLWSRQIQLLRKFVVIGNSIGPFANKEQEKQVVKLLTRSKLTTIRDGMSKLDLLNGTKTADLAFSLQDQYENWSEFKFKNKTILISLRRWKGINSKLDELAQFIDEEAKMGTQFILLPFAELPDEDTKIFDRLLDKIKNKNSVQLISYTDNFNRIQNLYKQVDLVIGMRLHSCIFSVIFSKPFIALSYNQKVVSFCNDIGMGEYCLDFHQITSDSLKMLVGKLEENYKEIESAYPELQNQLKESAMKNYQLLDEVMGSKPSS